MLSVKKNRSVKNKSINCVSKKNNPEPMKAVKFILLVLWGTVIALTVMVIFSTYAMTIFFGTLKWVDKSELKYRAVIPIEKITYHVDKDTYLLNDIIKFGIINNSNESIYLAPCQYFNRFEKKIAKGWQSINIESCTETEDTSSTMDIEKVSKKLEGTLDAKKLGNGIWRGVSTVYLGCQKAQFASCQAKKTVFTGEFTISSDRQVGYSNFR